MGIRRIAQYQGVIMHLYKNGFGTAGKRLKASSGIARALTMVLLFLGLMLPQGTLADTESKITKGQANEEIRMAVANIARYHPDPFHVTPRADFYAEVDRILKQEGDRTVASHYFDLARLSSLIFDTHTQLHHTEETPGFDRTFPLRFRIFPDGLYIIAGSEDYRDTIGQKVVSISGKEPGHVLEMLSGYSAADNRPRQKTYAETYLYWPETYEVFDLKTPSRKIELVLTDSTGKFTTRELEQTWDKGSADFSWDSQNPFLPKELLSVHDVRGTEVPYYLRKLDNNYWFEFLDAEKKYAYLQINQQFAKDPEAGEKPIEFHLKWSQALWNAGTEVLIIDLRNNPGGTINWGEPIPGILSDMFFEHEPLHSVALLFGTDTVSAGTILAAQLESAVKPIMIGSPSGSSPNMYLSAEKMTLPYSQLVFEVSTEVMMSSKEADTRGFLAPDIPMSPSFEDYANGRDPLIAYAKTIPETLRREIYKGNFSTPWKRASQDAAAR